jgi:hypothetical protein
MKSGDVLILQRNFFIDSNGVGQAGWRVPFNHGIMEYWNGGMMGLNREII